MPFVGNINLPGATGLAPKSALDRAREARERRKAAQPQSAAGSVKEVDETDLSEAARAEAAEHIRDLKGNDQQEAHQDRTSQGYYTLRNTVGTPPPEHPRLDVSG